jgi:hypothetical protein
MVGAGEWEALENERRSGTRKVLTPEKEKSSFQRKEVARDR